MKKEYNFQNAKRGAVISQKGKTRITIYIDNDVLEELRTQADEAGRGYQTIMNEVLREHLARKKRQEPIEDTIRRVIREELRGVSGN